MTKKPNYLVCNCEKSMNLDATLLAEQLGVEDLPIYSHLCRSQIGEFEKAIARGQAETQNCVVACTQEAPLFVEVGEELGSEQNLRFVNIRETAGWCSEKSNHSSNVNAKIAALLANIQLENKPTPLKSIQSDGLCLVYGSGQAALDIALQLSRTLSVTILLSDDAYVSLPTSMDIPIFKGKIKSMAGSLGAFSLTIDGYAAMLPSSRSGLEFAMARDGASTQCSVVFDLSGGQPLATGHKKRDGYIRVDPGDPTELYRKAFEACDLVGEFEKPIYVRYDADICAHSRSTIVGCSKCLDLCPAGAIQPDGDGVLYDDSICGGCGSCHASCPTGAVSYQYPDQNDLIARVQALASNYLEAGGSNPSLLIYNEQSGMEMISAIARYGKGLPANMLPIAVHSVASVGHVEMTAFLTAGVGEICILGDPNLEDEYDGLKAEITLATTICNAIGCGDENTIRLFCERDPEHVENLLNENGDPEGLAPHPFYAVGSKRDIARSAFSALKTAANSTTQTVELPQNAPYGMVSINQEACTLCMACVSACPAEAMIDTPGEPRLRFTEGACVQCGLCVKTCPEDALSLSPRLNLMPSAMQPITMNEEEPFCCISCGEAFATKSTIERIGKQLAGKHSMFQSVEMSRLLQMCENCRIEAQANSSNDPFAQGKRPIVRTTQDYIDAEDAGLSIDDFLIKH